MKKLSLYLLILFTIFAVSSFGQTKSKIPTGIKKAIQVGNSEKLAAHFSKSVELLIKNKEDVYSKAQAELILKDFFTKNVPNKFEIETEGKSDGINYVIGNLNTSGGKFKVYLSYQVLKGKTIINRLNISNYN